MALAAIGAGQPSSPSFIGWVGLFTHDLVDWLENENRLAMLCPDQASHSVEWARCRDTVLRPKVLSLRLRSDSSPHAPIIGDLLIEATPGKGLRAYYLPATGDPAVAFEPDLRDGDWGYGPYFHETVVERRDTWVRLPEGPFPKTAWLDTSALEGEASLRPLETGDIVTSPAGDLCVLAVEHGTVRARPEQERDMWCDEEPRPPLEPYAAVRLGAKDLFTPTGHLRLHIKYTRGC